MHIKVETSCSVTDGDKHIYPKITTYVEVEQILSLRHVIHYSKIMLFWHFQF